MLHLSENKYVNKTALVCLFCLTSTLCRFAFGADEIDNPTSQQGMTRYVWASNLTMRDQPNSKGAEVARLPLGTEVVLQPGPNPLIRYQDTILKLDAVIVGDPKNGFPEARVTLDGNWRKVHSQNHEGWVFDGYLSRYPVPPKNSESTDARQDELNFATRTFGAKLLQKWDANDSKKTPEYRAMRQHIKVLGSKDSVESWQYAEFQLGGNYEAEFVIHDGYSTFHNSYKKLPMTFNEALLWLRQFGYFTTAIGKFSGKFQTGHRLEFGPNDDSGYNWGMIVECSEDSCDFTYDHMD